MIKIAGILTIQGFQRFFTNVHQKCPFCRQNTLVKNGRKNGKQRYKCSACNKYLPQAQRLNNKQLLYEYIHLKQTYVQIAQRYRCHPKTVCRRIRSMHPAAVQTLPETACIIMDTTYFGRGYGVMVRMNHADGRILHKQYVRYETADLYRQGLRAVMDKGIAIQSITADGFKGIAELFPDIPFQLCQFHQQQIVRRYLTRRPKSEAAKDLKQLADRIFGSSEAEFKQQLSDWYEHHRVYLNEQSVSGDGQQKWYTHKRLRSAYNSLKRNLPYLFTFERYAGLCVPNTTNRLEGKFGELKTKIRCHPGMREQTKRLFIDNFFSG